MAKERADLQTEWLAGGETLDFVRQLFRLDRPLGLFAEDAFETRVALR